MTDPVVPFWGAAMCQVRSLGRTGSNVGYQ